MAVRSGYHDDRRPTALGELTVQADAAGLYVADFSALLDIRASDFVTVTAELHRGSMSRDLTSLYLGLRRSRAGVDVMTSALQPTRVLLLGPGGSLRSSVDVLAFESFDETGGAFLDAEGRPVYPQPGDRVLVRGPAAARCASPT